MKLDTSCMRTRYIVDTIWNTKNDQKYLAQMLEVAGDLHRAPLMPDEDKNFGGSLVLDFRK